MNSTVKDVMTTSVVAVGETATDKDIISAMIGRRASACPVLDVIGRVIGVVPEAPGAELAERLEVLESDRGPAGHLVVGIHRPHRCQVQQ